MYRSLYSQGYNLGICKTNFWAIKKYLILYVYICKQKNYAKTALLVKPITMIYVDTIILYFLYLIIYLY